MQQNLAQQQPEVGPGAQAELPQEPTLVDALVQHLHELGVERAFGVSGGAVALLFDALEASPIELHHFRQETGAAFAATEAHFATRKPTVVFSTTGPGTLNALTGIAAARWDGAKVILISGATNAAQRGRWATQETSSYTFPQDALYTRGPFFDFAVRVEDASELPEVVRRLALGVARPGGFVAHVCLPMSVQSSSAPAFESPGRVATMSAPGVSKEDVRHCAELLTQGPFCIWVGYGATRAHSAVRALAERTGAKVLCSPRAKGVISEEHPLFIGVTGLGGHGAVKEYIRDERPRWILVLGTRLGESTSFWDEDLLPTGGFIHVDLDPDVPGTAYPQVLTVGVHAELGQFVESLLPLLPEAEGAGAAPLPRREEPIPMRIAGRGPVRPQVLMQAIQRRVVEGSDAVVMSECGNAFAWCNHYLRFATAGRYRVSTSFGSMGHCAAGVVGAALARGSKAVAVVGDGSMLMNSEISTAAQYGAPAVWIVLNDAGYGMCRDGHRALGLTEAQTAIPCVDFVGYARSLGGDGVRVETEDMIDVALEQALAARGPFVVDVRIDPGETSPLVKRFESLIQQGNSKKPGGGGWEA